MSSHQDWSELTEMEISEFIENINTTPLEFASTEETQAHSETAQQFIESVLGFAADELVFISDESTLYDFDFINEVNIFEEKIKEVFGVDVSDIEDRNLLRIFQRIDGRG